MKIQLTLLMTGMWLAFPVGLLDAAPERPAPTTAGRMLIANNPTGQMRVHLSAPLVSDVDQTTPIIAGRLEIIEGPETLGGFKIFFMSSAALHFRDFDIDTSLRRAHLRQIGSSLNGAVKIVARPTAPGVFPFGITASAVSFHGAAIVDGDMNAGDQRPSQDVSGTIDLNLGRIQATVVLPQHQDIDCPIFSCGSIDGTLTITLTGQFNNDTDKDGVPDYRDNCALFANPGQEAVPIPLVVPPPDVEFSGCGAWAAGTARVTDLCYRRPTSVTSDAPSSYGVGTWPVTWRGDTAYHSSSAIQRVSVVDRTPPQFGAAPPPVTVLACAHPVQLPMVPEAHDDCGGITLANDAPYLLHVGETKSVRWTAVDGAGNSASIDQQVTGGPDTAPPQFTSAPVPITTNGCAPPVLVQPPVVDNCGAGIVVTNNAPVIFPVGQTAVTWTATDAASNHSTATQIVNVPPPPYPFVSHLLPPAWIDVCQPPPPAVIMPPFLTGMCGGPLHLTHNAPAYLPWGQTSVTWTVTDDTHHSATATQMVNVNQPPWCAPTE